MTSPVDNQSKAVQTASFYELLWSRLKDKLTYSEVFRAHFIVDYLQEIAGENKLRILDLGCGRGWMAAFLARFGSVTGIDFSSSGIKFAKENYGQYASFYLADPSSARLGLPANELFDLVICSEVIEHVPDQPSLIAQIKDFLKPDGFVIMTTPNKDHWAHYKAGVLFLSWLLRSAPGFQPVENWISPAECKTLLEKASFKLRRHEGQSLYFLGTPPFMSLGWLEYKCVDVVLRMFNLHHHYAKLTLKVSIYQLVVAQKNKKI